MIRRVPDDIAVSLVKHVNGLRPAYQTTLNGKPDRSPSCDERSRYVAQGVYEDCPDTKTLTNNMSIAFAVLNAKRELETVFNGG